MIQDEEKGNAVGKAALKIQRRTQEESDTEEDL